MLRLFRRRRRRSRTAAPTITPRSEGLAAVRVELAELTPAAEPFLGQAGYLLLVLFENLGRAVALAPTTAAKTTLSRAAAQVLEAHEGLVTELLSSGADPVAAMDPFRQPLDEYQRRIEGNDWAEILVTCYLTTGFLTDFFVGVAGGLPPGLADRVALLLDVDRAEQVLEGELRSLIEQNPRMASRLAMWGRRLIGDTMLVARSALVAAPGADGPQLDRIEPVFTELIGAHTRRMDALGLTA
ncbi:ferritin-like fold-containing protein [Pseudolysinimonas kribbensis]|uniref:Hydroxylase n=1 Tax=Pseudolysinimonas kribbensis TaxID=433641 RepID=A0ABQ6K6P5_9MICO|nr:ferritin-like fold-containing protein [Pseudolysinimonas kribbensis]GMA96315.1 hydroxylase [Pseudolysinimonas kribbensis]